MGFRNTSTAVIIVASLLLAFTYISPALTTIGELQDQIFVFRDNANKATEINSTLQSLVSEKNSQRQSDVVALETFLPGTVDKVQVMYDIETIANASNMTLRQIGSADSESAGPRTDVSLQNLGLSEEEMQAVEFVQAVDATNIEVVLTGSYSNLKRFLERLAINHYPLEVASLSFGQQAQSEPDSTETTSVESSTFTMSLRTYSFNY